MNDFLNKIKNGCILAQEKKGILASLSGAQAILESGWGKSELAEKYNNLFGVKASDDWEGKKVLYPSKEWKNGEFIIVNSYFRVYDSFDDSIVDHANFFTSTDWRKNNYKHVIGEKDYKKACQGLMPPLAQSGYATDPDYSNKLIKIIEEHKLFEWDTKGEINMKINNEFNLGANEGSDVKAQNYFIIIHETANPTATGRNEATYMKRNWRNAYTTDVIGDGGIDYRIGEWGYVSWGALNANPYAPVQIELQHTTDPTLFKKNYEAYIELIRKACDTFNIPKTLDTSGKWTKGVKSHKWCSENFGGDHTDPYSYLAKMGISKTQLEKDIKNGLGGNTVSSKIENKRPRQKIESYWYGKTSDKYNKIIKYLKNEKLNYKEEIGKDGRIKIVVTSFNPQSESKFKLERYLADNDMYFTVTDA